MSLDYIISVSVLINPIYRIPRAIGKRTMAGIFRSHGIRRGPSRGEGVVHAGAEVVVGPGGDFGPVAEPGVGECPAGQGCAAGQVQEETEASRSLA